MRTSITKYHKETDHENDHPEDVLAEDEATAETLTHEIGHNLGLMHDFQEDSNGNPSRLFRTITTLLQEIKQNLDSI